MQIQPHLKHQSKKKRKKETWNVEKAQELTQVGPENLWPGETRKGSFQLFGKQRKPVIWEIHSDKLFRQIPDKRSSSKWNEEIQSIAEIETTCDKKKSNLLHERIRHCFVINKILLENL